MQKGSQINLKIQDIAFGGDGVARTDECVVFVPFAAIGDELLVEITELKKNFARARILAINTPGPGRTAPLCPHYGKCGGCQYQHLDYQTEFAAKQKQLQDCLTRLGGLKALPPLDEAFPAPEPYGYRNKLRLEAKQLNTPPGATPQVDYGYYALDNKSFMRINTCRLARQELNKYLPEAIKSDWGKANAHRRKPEKPGALTLRIDNQNEIKYYFGFSPAKLGWLHEELAGVQYRVPVGSFWQVNPAVASKLLTTVDSWLQDLTLDTLIDAYCGVGTFACALTPHFKERLLIENDHAATEAADYNAQQKMLGCQVITDATEKALPKRLGKYPMATTLVVIDPPRTGCQDAVLQTLLENRPKFVLYVSCNPSTLARDLKKLTADNAYSLDKLAMFDMFPRTAHFETAVLLSAN